MRPGKLQLELTVTALGAALVALAFLFLSTPAGAGEAGVGGGLTQAGQLRLELGGESPQFVFDDGTTQLPQSVNDLRGITGRSKDRCILSLGDESNLVQIQAFQNVPGTNLEYIGEFSGGGGSRARGVGCYTVNSASNEGLTLTLDTDLAGLVVGESSIDVEVRGNVAILATATFVGSSAPPSRSCS